MDREVVRLNKSVADLAHQRQQLLQQTELVTAELEAEREEVTQLNEQVTLLSVRVRDLKMLEQEVVKEREANSVLIKERERLQEVAKESTWAQNGLSALSDEHEILQTELQSLEQSLMRKEQTAREQAREMQRLQAHNADLESQVEILESQLCSKSAIKKNIGLTF